MKTSLSRKHVLHILKLIGVVLFIWILSKIDKQQIVQTIISSNKPYIGFSFAILLCSYAVKSIRWHLLTKLGGIHSSTQESWRIFMIGIFLATITPAKTGEFGRAAYLKEAGMKTKHALGIVIADRLCDVACIAILAIGAVGVLFGWQAAVLIGICALIGGALFICILQKRFALKNMLDLNIGIFVSLCTIVAWILYFCWAIVIARSIGIEVSAAIMVATLTITGILSLLPIAPSGLGTREAALITLLAPYGAEPEQAVSLAFLMFISIILSGILGGIYWIKGVKITTSKLQ